MFVYCLLMVVLVRFVGLWCCLLRLLFFGLLGLVDCFVLVGFVCFVCYCFDLCIVLLGFVCGGWVVCCFCFVV